MARKLKESRTEPGFRSVPVEGARKLVTIGPEHKAWGGMTVPWPEDLTGAIVWISPPESATDEQVANLAAHVGGLDVAAVKVEKRRRGKVVLETKEKRPKLKARAVVIELASTANVSDRQALVGFCEKVLARCSL
jgi:hypothetical protein